MTSCIACSGTPVALVKDGTHRKPICETHVRLYSAQGYEIARLS